MTPTTQESIEERFNERFNNPEKYLCQYYVGDKSTVSCSGDVLLFIRQEIERARVDELAEVLSILVYHTPLQNKQEENLVNNIARKVQSRIRALKK